jgi:ubiquinone/menaquinone biosynthesis C-methylase UbiE
MAKDLFSRQTSSYARYRPTYPVELFEFLLGFVEEREVVWDCGTGNGQAALVLAEYFKQVKATDISQNQLSLARQHPNIEYLVCPAEKLV